MNRKSHYIPANLPSLGQMKVNQAVDEPPVTKEVLAQAIVNISKSFDRLLKSGLNKRAIIILIAHDTKLGIGQIENVLGSLERLAYNYARY